MKRRNAALLAVAGEIITGSNVENASYGLTVCAERNAVAAAVAAGRRKFRAVAIVAGGKEAPRPCGACLQVLGEFCGRDAQVFSARDKVLKGFKKAAISELLPERFDFPR